MVPSLRVLQAKIITVMLFGIEFRSLKNKRAPICAAHGHVEARRHFTDCGLGSASQLIGDLSTVLPPQLRLKAWSVPSWQQTIYIPSTCQKRAPLLACCPVPTKRHLVNDIYGILPEGNTFFLDLLNFILGFGQTI